MITILKISQSVPLLTEAFVSFTPTEQKTTRVISFVAEAVFANNRNVRLIWKYGDPDEEILWTTSGQSKMPFDFDIPIEEINGARRLAIVLDNAGPSASYMSGFAEVKIYD